MPVTQRWVHGGLVFVAIIFSMSLTVLVLGASRPTINNAGLNGSVAPQFTLRDDNGQWVRLKDFHEKTAVLLFVPADATSFARQAPLFAGLIDSFGKDSDVRFVGVEFDPHAGILAESKVGSGALETSLPNVQTLRDIDGSVAQAFRVPAAPTLFVIDPQGVIRSRVKLDNDGSIIAASEMISSLRHTDITLPNLSGDRKEF